MVMIHRRVGGSRRLRRRRRQPDKCQILRGSRGCTACRSHFARILNDDWQSRARRNCLLVEWQVFDENNWKFALWKPAGWIYLLSEPKYSLTIIL